MSITPFPIGNTNNSPLNNVNGRFVNIDNSNVGGISTTSTTIPNGEHTLSAPGSNIQSAAGIYPSFQKGGKINRGKINRKKINKISRKYKMKGSKKTIRRHVRRIKSRLRRHSRKHSRKYSNRSRHIKGGGFQPPMVTPNYPLGHTQYLLNNGSQSNVYALGGNVSAANSALANPPLVNKLLNATQPDNENHATLNANGNIGSGSGFPSRGWF
jgi:hypothetical protein